MRNWKARLLTRLVHGYFAVARGMTMKQEDWRPLFFYTRDHHHTTRFTYGLSEKQFRNLYEEANKTKGVTGELMLQLLERRLDNIVYRAGLAATRPQARQFVNHGHFDVNGSRVTVPSYRVRVGDTITLRPKSRDMVQVQWNKDVLDRQAPGWLESGESGNSVTVRAFPEREQIDVPVREQLIVELYSK